MDKLLSADPASNNANPNMLTGSVGKKFSETGVLLAYRDITPADVEKLRSGQTLDTVGTSFVIGITDPMWTINLEFPA